MFKKLNTLIQKQLHTVKDGLQLVQFEKLFSKKMLISDQLDIHSDFDCKLKELSNVKQVRIVVEDHNVSVLGGFENSNILHATIQQNEIKILLNADTNTNGCTHWFSFIIISQTQCIYTIKILNNRRKNTLFTKGNHIHTQEGQDEWGNNTSNVFYYRTNINHPFYFSDQSDIALIQQNLELYTLEFQISLKANTTTRVAMNLPYTVKDLQILRTYLLKNDVNIKSIGKTPLGLPILRIKFKPNFSSQLKNSIVFLARQHPSESQGSHICEALIKKLTSSVKLPFLVIIYPMVNPDGVFMGNSRCNWHGVDLNRKWDFPDQTSPEILIIKSAIVKLHSKSPILFLIDLHGHSNEMDQFIYGCIPDSILTFEQYIQSKLFAKLLHNQSLFFSYESCRFRVVPQMKSTARVMFFQYLGILNSLTIETSFFGYQNRDDQRFIKFTRANFIEMAGDLLICLEKYKEKSDQLKSLYIQKNYFASQPHRQPMNQVKKQTKLTNGTFTQNQDDVFSIEELQKINLSFSKGINPVAKEALPDSDTEAEQDLRPNLKILLTSLMNKNKRQNTEFQHINMVQPQTKVRTQENQSEEKQIQYKPKRQSLRIKQEYTQLHLVDFNDTIQHYEAPRLIQQTENEETSTLQTIKLLKPYLIHNTYQKRQRQISYDKKSLNISNDNKEIRFNEVSSELPMRRQHSRSQIITEQIPIEPEKNNILNHRNSRSQFIPFVQVNNSKIRRQHSKSQLLVRQSPVMNNINLYYGLSQTTCSAQYPTRIVTVKKQKFV